MKLKEEQKLDNIIKEIQIDPEQKKNDEESENLSALAEDLLSLSDEYNVELMRKGPINKNDLSEVSFIKTENFASIFKLFGIIFKERIFLESVTAQLFKKYMHSCGKIVSFFPMHFIQKFIQQMHSYKHLIQELLSQILHKLEHSLQQLFEQLSHLIEQLKQGFLLQ